MRVFISCQLCDITHLMVSIVAAKSCTHCSVIVCVCDQKLLTGLVACRCAAMDFRGHGDTKTVSDQDLSADTMARYVCVGGAG